MRRILSMLLFLASCQNLLAQYTLNGNATQDACNAYSLTQAAGNQSGSVWNNNKINLTQSFDFNFDINLGSNDAGADGIAFVLQPLSTSVGSSGGGLGYNGITPAVGVTIDTWQNGNDNDPAYDHIAIQLNGDLNHNTANNIAKDGIENMFAENHLSTFATTISTSLGNKTLQFDKSRKRDFENFILGRNCKDDFINFAILTDRIKELNAIAQSV